MNNYTIIICSQILSIRVLFPKASAKLQKTLNMQNIYRFFSAIFYIMLFLFCKITVQKKQALSPDNALPSQSAEQKTI